MDLGKGNVLNKKTNLSDEIITQLADAISKLHSFKKKRPIPIKYDPELVEYIQEFGYGHLIDAIKHYLDNISHKYIGLTHGNLHNKSNLSMTSDGNLSAILDYDSLDYDMIGLDIGCIKYYMLGDNIEKFMNAYKPKNKSGLELNADVSILLDCLQNYIENSYDDHNNRILLKILSKLNEEALYNGNYESKV